MNTRPAKSCKQLLSKFHELNHRAQKGKLLSFAIGNDLTVYNPTRPFGETLMFGRVEPFEDEVSSQIVLFERRRSEWIPLDRNHQFSLQDPFHIENIDGFHVFGGVEVFRENKNSPLRYHTIFYRYRNDIYQAQEPFCVGPDGVKDIRLIQLFPGRIGVFTRPQGGKAGRGKIGYTEIDSLDKLTAQLIEQAPIINRLFIDEEWGGANELHLLANGTIGVLGHIACIRGQQKSYYSMTFAFDPTSRQAYGVKIIATAKQFPPVKPKNRFVNNVLFSGGLTRKSGGQAELYVGINDTAAGVVAVPDPFLEYER